MVTLILLHVQAINLVSWKIQLDSSPRSDRTVPKERVLVTSFYQTKLLIRQKKVKREGRQINFYIIHPSLSCHPATMREMVRTEPSDIVLPTQDCVAAPLRYTVLY